MLQIAFIALMVLQLAHSSLKVWIHQTLRVTRLLKVLARLKKSQLGLA